MSNKTQAPTTLPLTHAHCQVNCVSTEYDGQFSSRYLSDKVRLEVEQARMDADDEAEVAAAVQKVLASVNEQAETFWNQIDGESNDNFNGIETGTTESADGLTRFAKDNEGLTLSQLFKGVDYEGGVIKVDFEDLINSNRFDQEFNGDIDECWEAAEAAANHYVLKGDATLVLSN